MGSEAERHFDEADKVWDHFPEAAQSEREFVMFVGRLPHHGKLIVTRYEDGCAIFRVLNEDLAKLELGAERLVRSVTEESTPIPGLVINGNEVEVYEKGNNRVIIRSNIISKPLREAFRRHTGTAVTIAATAGAAAASVILLTFPKLPGALWPPASWNAFPRRCLHQKPGSPPHFPT